MPRFHTRTTAGLAAPLAGLLLSACVSTMPGPDGNYARPVGGAPVTPNPTPYSAALNCLAGYAALYGVAPPRIAVGRLSDLTGRLDENGGRTVTQGAALMAMSALGKAGVPLVERYETDVSKLEYQLADNSLIGDGPTGQRDYRPIFPGDMSGSDYFLTGGITELNSNIRGSNAGLKAAKDDGDVKVALVRAQRLRHERRRRHAAGRHPLARRGADRLLPEADHRPPHLRRPVQLLRRQRGQPVRPRRAARSRSTWRSGRWSSGRWSRWSPGSTGRPIPASA